MIPDTRLTSPDFSTQKTQAQRRRRAASAEKAQPAQTSRAERAADDDPFAPDNSTDVGKFFGGPTDAVAESHALWAELGAQQQRAPRQKLHRGMVWTAVIALLGLLLNGGYLLYHKVWMPAPVELDLHPPTLLLPQQRSTPPTR